MNRTGDVQLRCQQCDARHNQDDPLWRCRCGGILDVVMPPRFPMANMARRPAGLWRYQEALPLTGVTAPVQLGEPMTPLLATPSDLHGLFLKLDFLFPTGSFNDRGAAVLISKARELGMDAVIEDSSGNAGAAIAAYAGAAGIRASIFVPSGAAPAKIAQISAYGARIVKVPGSRDQTSRAALKQAERTYYASHIWNPFFLEGTKTIAFEIWEQLGHQVPDWVVAPVGHGTLLLGLFKGFDHLRRAGVTAVMPRIVGVQAEACAPLCQAFHSPNRQLPDLFETDTLADGIAIARPVRWRQILNAVAETGGTLVSVAEEAIEESLKIWSRRGILMEPTSATALAAWQQLRAQHIIAPGATVVVPVTGSGIKHVCRAGN